MNDLPRQKLCELIVEYGRSLCDDPRRCEALLKDYCGQHKREIFVLVSALKNRVATELLNVSASVPEVIVLSRLSKRLEDELGLTEIAAAWAVETWALALRTINPPLPVMQPASVSPPSPPPPTKPSLIAGRYRDHGDGTVTDVETGLQWMRFSLGQEWKNGICIGAARRYTWQETIDAAETLNRQGSYAGYRDWRIPTKEELQTLVLNGQSLVIDQFAFPETQGGWYWSSSIDVVSPERAWGVYFKNGNVYTLNKLEVYYVRLTRSTII